MFPDPYTHLALHKLRATALRKEASAYTRPTRPVAPTAFRVRLGELLIAWGTRLTHASPAGAA